MNSGQRSEPPYVGCHGSKRLFGSMPGHLFADFESASLAERSRLYRKIIGVDTEYVLAKTVTEKEADLNTFTSGQVVKVRVSAMHDAGESSFPFVLGMGGGSPAGCCSGWAR